MTRGGHQGRRARRRRRAARPDGYATVDPDFPEDPYGLGDLGPEGQAAIRTWVEDGGRYVGWLDGAVLASGVGVSSATFESAEDSGISSPGALIRTTVARRSPLADGVGRSAYAFYDSRYVMRANGAAAPVRFPSASTRDFFVSGYADGAEALSGSAAVVDEPVGDGRTVAFGFEPNFRAFTDGTERILRNALLGAAPASFEDAASEPALAARAAAKAVAAPHDPVRLVVKASGERAAAARAGAPGPVAPGGPDARARLVHDPEPGRQGRRRAAVDADARVRAAAHRRPGRDVPGAVSGGGGPARAGPPHRGQRRSPPICPRISPPWNVCEWTFA